MPARPAPVPIDDPSRSGRLLSGGTLQTVTGQLIDSVFPEPGAYRRATEGHLLATGTSPPGDTPITVIWWALEQLRYVGRRCGIRPEVWPELTLSADSIAETKRRKRAAQAFGLPPLTRPSRRPPWWTRQLTGDMASAVRLLTAAGPLYTDDLIDTITQTHQHGRSRGVDPDKFVAALVATGAKTMPGDGRWCYDGEPDARDLALIAAAAATGRTRHTFDQIAELITRSGHAARDQRVLVARHPFVERTGRNRYRVIGAGAI